MADQSKRFSISNFESKIPHGMRFKQYNVVNDNELYWVTQELFTEDELDQFAKAFTTLPYDKAYVTVRDFSGYDFDGDLLKDRLAVVYADGSYDISNYKKTFMQVYPQYVDEYFESVDFDDLDSDSLVDEYIADYKLGDISFSKLYEYLQDTYNSDRNIIIHLIDKL